MKFLLQYPDLHGSDNDFLDAGSIADVATAAERAGWHGLSFTEHPAPGAKWLDAGGHQTLDPFVALGAAAAVTSKIRLLTYLAVLPYRNPLLLAKSAASVDRISNGRFILGAGTGYLKSEFRALGVDFEERNELFDEALDVLPLHWSGDTFSYTGKHFSARDVMARPRPVQNPIPIWLGGNATITLRRVAERAQGWMPLLGSAVMATTTRTAHLESLESVAERVRMLRDFAGDRADAIDIVLSYYELAATDPTKEIERHRDMFGRMAELGATWVVITAPWAPAPATTDFIEAIGATYISTTP
jgi:probable F420-dependent oxidoreductase